MTLRLGMIGSSEGNGHPFSFSAIINGYDSARLRTAGWGVIADYLDPRDPAEFGVGDVRVTHAWCPDPAESTALCESTSIPNRVGAVTEMRGSVDAVIIARDDWEVHRDLADPFLAAGVPVFLDKPLSLSREDLTAFRPHLEAGRLMSSSGFRFAVELDRLRAAVEVSRAPMVLEGVGPREWDRYAVHLIEPLLTLTAAVPVAVLELPAQHDAVAIQLSDQSLMIIHCLGDAAPGFVLNVTSGARREEIVLSDRFTAFRRLLVAFVSMVVNGAPVIDPDETTRIMEVVISRREGGAAYRPVPVDFGIKTGQAAQVVQGDDGDG